jgi:hypothetical protein
LPLLAARAFEKLLVIDVVNAEGVLLLQTAWATTLDRQHGPRRTDIERFDRAAALLGRLAQLVPLMMTDIVEADMRLAA